MVASTPEIESALSFFMNAVLIYYCYSQMIGAGIAQWYGAGLWAG
jgi:hypothetical protein